MGIRKNTKADIRDKVRNRVHSLLVNFRNDIRWCMFEQVPAVYGPDDPLEVNHINHIDSVNNISRQIILEMQSLELIVEIEIVYKGSIL
jgi:hypothetical protein